MTATLFLIVPVVFASHQPPAIICQPSGLIPTGGLDLIGIRLSAVSLLESNVVNHHRSFFTRALIAVHADRDGSQLLQDVKL